ncbi:hypothetical protein SDJN02_07446, partial [Cucurbita argyrosperma subsp. argyrosperma]
MTHPMAVPITWLTNIDRGEDSVMYPVLKSCIRSDAVETMFIITPQAAKPATTPPCEAPAHAPILRKDMWQCGYGYGCNHNISSNGKPGGNLIFEEELSPPFVIKRNIGGRRSGSIRDWDYIFLFQLAVQTYKSCCQHLYKVVTPITQNQGNGDKHLKPQTELLRTLMRHHREEADEADDEKETNNPS